jgi:hypothetical protein
MNMKNNISLAIAGMLMQLAAHAQVSFDDYVFTAPENWLVQKNKDFILLAQNQDLNAGCVVQILLPAASSGNLEKDAQDVFAMMYPGWEYRNAGEKQHDLIKGHTPQGLEYCIMEAPMKKVRPDGYYYDYEDGSAVVIGLEKQMIILAARHNRLLACECGRKYNLWKRFFKSFTVKNAKLPVNTSEEPAKKIIGVWKVAESMAISDYVFAANGHFQHGGAIGSSSTSRDQYYEYLHIKSYSFEGDGTWSISKNEITLKKRGSKEDKKAIRFEKVNHGGTGWKDRMFMMGKDVAGEYETCYEKQDK